MKKLLLLSTLLIFACSNDDNTDNSDVNLLEFLKGKVYQKEIPGGGQGTFTLTCLILGKTLLETNMRDGLPLKNTMTQIKA